MEDLTVVGMLNGTGDLYQVSGRHLARQWAVSQSSGQTRAFDEIHAEVRSAVHLADFVNSHDVRWRRAAVASDPVLKRCRSLSLATDPARIIFRATVRCR